MENVLPQTDNNTKEIIDGINFRELWDEYFEKADGWSERGDWSKYYDEILAKLNSDKTKKNLLNGVETFCKTLYMTEKIKGLESDMPTPIIWVLSLMLVKRTADMLRLKSKDEVREKKFGKENCEIYAKLLDHYRKNLEIIVNSTL